MFGLVARRRLDETQARLEHWERVAALRQVGMDAAHREVAGLRVQLAAVEARLEEQRAIVAKGLRFRTSASGTPELDPDRDPPSVRTADRIHARLIRQGERKLRPGEDADDDT